MLFKVHGVNLCIFTKKIKIKMPAFVSKYGRHFFMLIFSFFLTVL